MSKHVDAALAYARAVVAGEVLASKWTRLTCQRQLDDLERATSDDWPWVFSAERAARPCEFVELLPHIKGKWAREGRLIELEPWQCFIITTVFGWVHRETGLRRYREVYVEVPRKNAKSTLSSGLALYMLTADGEHGAEVYSAATTRDQARIVFDDAKAMAQRTPDLRTCLGVAILQHSITVAYTSSKFAPLAAEGGLAAQEFGADALTAFVAVGISGSVAVQDGPDGFAGTAAVVVTGVAFLAEQGIDAFAGVGGLIVSGVMAAQEVAADTLTALGAVGVTGSMSVFDAGSDVLTGSGAVWVAGSAAVQEAGGDTFTGTGGELVLLPIVGLMAAAEDGVDAFVAAASVQIDAFLDAQELGGDVGAGLALTLAPLQALPPGSGYNRPTKGCSRPAMAALVRPETVNAARPHMTNTKR